MHVYLSELLVIATWALEIVPLAPSTHPRSRTPIPHARTHTCQLFLSANLYCQLYQTLG